MSFATLQEAWCVATFGDVDMKQATRSNIPDVKASEVLERGEAARRSMYFVTNYLKDVYEQHGVAGIMSLLDERAIRDLRMAAIFSFDWLDANVMLFIFMCLCGMWLAMDILRRRV